MDYKIRDICTSLGISSKTFYKRLDVLKNCIPSEELNSNEYFYRDSNKFFVTEKGFEWFKNFDNKQNSTKFDGKNQSNSKSNNDIAIIYQNQIIDMYKNRIEYLETENKRLLDIIAVKEQKEIAELAQKSLDSGDNKKDTIFTRLFRIFKNDSEKSE